MCAKLTLSWQQKFVCLRDALDQKECYSDDWALVLMDYWTKKSPLEDDLHGFIGGEYYFILVVRTRLIF